MFLSRVLWLGAEESSSRRFEVRGNPPILEFAQGISHRRTRQEADPLQVAARHRKLRQRPIPRQVYERLPLRIIARGTRSRPRQLGGIAPDLSTDVIQDTVSLRLAQLRCQRRRFADRCNRRASSLERRGDSRRSEGARAIAARAGWHRAQAAEVRQSGRAGMTSAGCCSWPSPSTRQRRAEPPAASEAPGGCARPKATRGPCAGGHRPRDLPCLEHRHHTPHESGRTAGCADSLP